MASSLPAIVKTVRWWVESEEKSSRLVPSVRSTACMARRMTLRLLPSLIFGIDSIIYLRKAGAAEVAVSKKIFHRNLSLVQLFATASLVCLTLDAQQAINIKELN